MKCPIDDTELKMTERQGIEVDYCPKCRGVWLDRGELDKIIERSGEGEQLVKQVTEPRHRDGDRYREERRDDRHYASGDRHYGKKKKSSILSEIFDF